MTLNGFNAPFELYILNLLAVTIKSLVPPPPISSKPVKPPLESIVTPYFPVIPFILVVFVFIDVVCWPTVVLNAVTEEAVAVAGPVSNAITASANAEFKESVPSDAIVPKLAAILLTYVVEAKFACVVVDNTELANASESVIAPFAATVPKLEPKVLTNADVANVVSVVVVITLLAKA